MERMPVAIIQEVDSFKSSGKRAEAASFKQNVNILDTFDEQTLKIARISCQN